jgi:hypothetical protein
MRGITGNLAGMQPGFQTSEEQLPMAGLEHNKQLACAIGVPSGSYTCCFVVCCLRLPS